MHINEKAEYSCVVVASTKVGKLTTRGTGLQYH